MVFENCSECDGKGYSENNIFCMNCKGTGLKINKTTLEKELNTKDINDLI